MGYRQNQTSGGALTVIPAAAAVHTTDTAVVARVLSLLVEASIYVVSQLC